MRNYSEEEQALVDGVEFGIDNALEVAKEDIREYRRLTGTENMVSLRPQEQKTVKNE